MAEDRVLTASLRPLTFVYEPLLSSRHIRLITLYPGPWSSDLRCRVQQINLDDPDGSNPIHEALSYTWGDPNPSHTLFCNDGSFKIGNNLHSALLHLRSEQSPRVLWIDAICINQNDVPERNAQVRLMSEIYYEAGRVVIWLGESDETTLDGISMLQGLERRLTEGRSHKPSKFDFEEPDFEMDETWNTESELSLPLRNILQRPWFSRMWVLQESSLARAAMVLCGHHVITWETLFNACFYLNIAPRTEKFIDTSIVDTMNFVWAQQSKFGEHDSFRYHLLDRSGYAGLLHLLSLTNQSAESTDARDKVYALLGLSREGLNGELAPDYSLSFREAYIKTAKTLIRLTGSIKILSLAEHKKSLDDVVLPSWVPDWRRRGETLLETKSPLGFDPGFDAFYSAAGTTPAITNEVPLPDPDVFSAAGFRLSTISKVWSVPPALQLLERVPCKLGQGWKCIVACPEFLEDGSEPEQDLAKTHHQYYTFPGGEEAKVETIAEAYGSTLCADLWYFSPRINDLYRRVYFPTMYPRLQQVTREDVADPEWMKAIEFAAGFDWIRHVNRMMVKRKAFRTIDGMMGICPETAQAGDEVVILPGGDVPLILRHIKSSERELNRRVESSEKWSLIGESYVHGIMDGEALKPSKDGSIQPRKFRIV